MMVTQTRRASDTPPIEPERESWRGWLVGAFFTLILGFGAAGYQSVNARLTSLEASGSPMLRERISAMEARHDAMQRQIDADNVLVRAAILRIEAKLDANLERMSAQEARRR